MRSKTMKNRAVRLETGSKKKIKMEGSNEAKKIQEVVGVKQKHRSKPQFRGNAGGAGRNGNGGNNGLSDLYSV